LGHDAATDAEIEAAAGLTGLWPVLERNQPQAPLEAPMGASGAGFSGGERRLFAITRALLRCPRILLLDEPTTGIDAIAVEALERCIRGIRAGLSVIMVEHHLEFAGRLADEICCLEDGVFTAIGAPADLAARPGLYATLLAARRGIDLDQMEIESVPMPRLGRSPGAAPGIPTGIPLGLPIGGRLGGRAKS
jgi:ABC-type multidrug transport system fused ATPase/permease subunit